MAALHVCSRCGPRRRSGGCFRRQGPGAAEIFRDGVRLRPFRSRDCALCDPHRYRRSSRCISILQSMALAGTLGEGCIQNGGIPTDLSALTVMREEGPGDRTELRLIATGIRGRASWNSSARTSLQPGCPMCASGFTETVDSVVRQEAALLLNQAQRYGTARWRCFLILLAPR